MGASLAFAIAYTIGASLVTVLPTIAPSPSPAPAPSATPESTPIILSAGLGRYARSQGDAAKWLLYGLEYAFATEIYLETGKAVRFRTAPESADYIADCAVPSPASGSPSPLPTSDAILELTYGQTISITSDYFLMTHHAEQVNIGAVLLDCQRHVLGYFPPIPTATPGVHFEKNGNIKDVASYYTFANQANAFSLVGLYGAGLIANANNDNKIAGALVTFMGAAQSVDVPAYPKDSRAADAFRDAVFHEAWWLLHCTNPDWLAKEHVAFKSSPEPIPSMTGAPNTCPPSSAYATQLPLP